jgi:hypothetical protein
MNEQAEKKSMGGCGKIAIGCGIVLVIVVIIAALGTWYVAKNARGWLATGFATGVNSAVEQSALPDEQKQAIQDRVEQISEDFAAGDITMEELGKAVEELDIENLIDAGMAQYVGAGLIDSSKLSDEDKAAGRQAFNRVAYGLLDDQIDSNDVQQILAPILLNPGSNDWQFKQNPTTEEIKQVMDNATELADQAGVPADVEEVDFGARVNEAFDEALGIQ